MGTEESDEVEAAVELLRRREVAQQILTPLSLRRRLLVRIAQTIVSLGTTPGILVEVEAQVIGDELIAFGHRIGELG